MRFVKISLSVLASFAIALSLTMPELRADDGRGSVHSNDVSDVRRAGMAGTAQDPITQVRIHNIGNIRLPVTNWGALGNDFGNLRDPITGLRAPGGEFPRGSNLEYLGKAALWIGAIVPDAKGNAQWLVSIGGERTSGVVEFLPAPPSDGGLIQERSTRNNSPYFRPNAVSEQDFVTVFTDTIVDPQVVQPDDWSFRPHVPVGVEVRQESYAWSYEYAKNFIILRYFIKNLNPFPLQELYVGMFVDPQVAHVSTVQTSSNDDQIGFRARSDRILPLGETLEINTMWFADNDGDGRRGYTAVSPRGVAGIRLISQPIEEDWCWLSRWYDLTSPSEPASFNWWASGAAGTEGFSFFYDWGPQHYPGRANPIGTYGTPYGDRQKYHFLSNGEIDYDQLETSIDRSQVYDEEVPDGWIEVAAPSDVWTQAVTRGFNSSGLLSSGPYDIEPNESVEVAFAYVNGERFHSQPDIWKMLPNRPDNYRAGLDFESLDLAAAWASWVYDNPGIDTDHDWCSGDFYTFNCRDTFYIVYFGENNQYAFPVNRVCDTVYTTGDGIIDLSGPPPPPSPDIVIQTLPGEISIHWSGEASELFRDPFSQRHDFEGYRVYWGAMDSEAGMSLLGSWDLVNYRRYELKPNRGVMEWVVEGAPMTVDSLRALYGQSFDPQAHSKPESAFSFKGRSYYFVGFGDNRGNEYYDDGHYVVNPLQSVSTDSAWNEGRGVWEKFGHYEFRITQLLGSVGFYFSVTAIDHGFLESGLDPLESAVSDNVQYVYPSYSSDEVVARRPPVIVYPNPYKATGQYRLDGFEDPNHTGFIERERRVHFRNLPEQAVIRIYTLDGDLVREIHHPDPYLSDTDSHCAWDLISRNTQAAVSGIYYWSVESELGTENGKLVIIR